METTPKYLNGNEETPTKHKTRPKQITKYVKHFLEIPVVTIVVQLLKLHSENETFIEVMTLIKQQLPHVQTINRGIEIIKQMIICALYNFNCVKRNIYFVEHLC